MDAIIDGKSVDDAGYLSGKAFIAAFGDLASSGNSIEDPACAGAGFLVLLCLLCYQPVTVAENNWFDRA